MQTSGTWGARVAALVLLSCALLAGCATPTITRTTVVLLPDEDNKVGSVTISTAAGTQRLKKAFSYSTVDGSHAIPSNARTVSRGALDRMYGDLLKVNPQAPRIFVLQFLLDKTELTEDSKAMLPAMFRAVRVRKPASITVFGHADAIGSKERNWNISADRAEAVANLLREHDRSLRDVNVQFFGDTKPKTPAGALAPDARNRRVEVLIF